MAVFYKTTVFLENYNLRECPKSLVVYRPEWRKHLETGIRWFQKELNWDKMWTIEEADQRLERGWQLIVYRPKNQIKGWTWISDRGEIKNVYINKYRRKLGLGKAIIWASLNRAYELEMPFVFWKVDIWNTPSQLMFESIIENLGCRTYMENVDEDYSSD